MKTTRISVAILISLGLCIASVRADEVLDTLAKAKEQYEKNEFSGAAGSLDYAAQLVRQKKSDALKLFLPKALEGWTAEEATSQAMGASFFGGGVTVSQHFNKESSSVTVEIVTDSPLLQSVMMMLTNPVMISASGAKLETISGQQAVVNFRPTEKSGDISFVVANRFLVKVSGNDVLKKDLSDYVSKIDFAKLAAAT